MRVQKMAICVGFQWDCSPVVVRLPVTRPTVRVRFLVDGSLVDGFRVKGVEVILTVVYLVLPWSSLSNASLSILWRGVVSRLMTFDNDESIAYRAMLTILSKCKPT